MKIVCISDTHNKHRDLNIPSGDIILHSGDFTDAGTKTETVEFLKWFSALPHKHKLLVPGNHDFYLEKNLHDLGPIIPENIDLLVDEEKVINGIKFWGSPFTPGNGSWAFNKNPGREMANHWQRIPEDTDFLITHSPPYGILDELDNKRHIGCERLLEQIKKLKIPHHIFGHNHNDYGLITRQNTVYMNASSVDNSYRFINPPLVWETLSS